MPTLVEHLISHAESGDNFSDFITKHYGSEARSHKNEHKEHKELPFKHKHLESHFQHLYTFYFQDIVISFKELTFKENKFAYTEPSTTLYVNNLLQPPQK